MDTTGGLSTTTQPCRRPSSSTHNRIGKKRFLGFIRTRRPFRAFRLMKGKLVSAPILAYPQFHGAPFILDTDFSVDPGAIGGVLSQVQDGQGASNRLRGPETSAQGTELRLHQRRTTGGNFLSPVFINTTFSTGPLFCVPTTAPSPGSIP